MASTSGKILSTIVVMKKWHQLFISNWSWIGIIWRFQCWGRFSLGDLYTKAPSQLKFVVSYPSIIRVLGIFCDEWWSKKMFVTHKWCGVLCVTQFMSWNMRLGGNIKDLWATNRNHDINAFKKHIFHDHLNIYNKWELFLLARGLGFQK